ncbi:hypothetical protein [Sporosarcina sp. FSL K6-1508]|uniref:hypothetical protein n=1 Tax=Sporosarcina sp. FSL K6-1508 TaxID=2921553 RepID=UPI0030F6EB82
MSKRDFSILMVFVAIIFIGIMVMLDNIDNVYEDRRSSLVVSTVEKTVGKTGAVILEDELPMYEVLLNDEIYKVKITNGPDVLYIQHKDKVIYHKDFKE